MSESQVTIEYTRDGIRADPTTVKLSDPTSTYGIKRDDNDAVVVADGTDMVKLATGVYQYTFTDAAFDLTYTAFVEIVDGTLPEDHQDFAVVGTKSPSTIAGTLGFVRRKFVDLSGRFDLVTDAAGGDYSDNGADFLINAASRWLDRKLGYKFQEAWLQVVLAAGDVFKLFEDSRIIKEVWLADSAGGRTKLEHVPLETLRNCYPEVDTTTIDAARPTQWALLPIGLAPEQRDDTLVGLQALGIVDTDYLSFGEYQNKRGITILAPADQAYTLEVLAEWYSRDLTLDAQTNFWTANHSDLLVRATKLQVEMNIHRNTQGVNDEMATLLDDVHEVLNDINAEEYAGKASDWVQRI